MSDENQHWVPKFLIKQFADTDGRVFCMDIQSGKISKPPPRRAASGVGFNNFIIDGVSVSFEDRLEKIETAAAPILKRIIEAKSVANLGSEERGRVAEFIAAQSFRTDAFYKGLQVSSSRQEFGAIFRELWRGAFLISAEIARRKWVVMTIEHSDVFYLGDHPVVLQNTDNPEAAQNLGFDVKGTEIFLPLTPKCALYMPCTSVSEQRIGAYLDALAAPDNLRRANELGVETSISDEEFLALAQRVLDGFGPLYRSLTDGVAYVASPENVENLNYLQCAWAHAALYSNRRDFTFAKHVLSKTPQYRELVKVRLVTYGYGAPL